MGKRSKSCNTVNEDIGAESKRVKNKKSKLECSNANNDFKPEEVRPSGDTEVKKQKKRKQQKGGGDEKKNTKIIFNDDDDEPVKNDNPIIQQEQSAKQFSQENEEDIKDEDIDKFCDELNEEDNEQYESWVKLIEAKLNSNKKKPK